jgi:NAD-dependent deacetylase
MKITKELIDKVKNASAVAVLTGAGISAESGIPTFRGQGGYWRNYKAEELATPEAFERDPQLVWEWYDMRRKICSEAKPNSGHIVVADMERHYSKFLLITQNVDGLHRRAGNNKLHQIHGDIFTARCNHCGNVYHHDEVPLKLNPPECPLCKSRNVRPHIVWFGETYFPGILEACYEFLKKVDLIFVIGTSGQVSIPVSLASYAIMKGAYSIEINPDRSTLSTTVNVHLSGKAGEILPELWKEIFD